MINEPNDRFSRNLKRMASHYRSTQIVKWKQPLSQST